MVSAIRASLRAGLRASPSRIGLAPALVRPGRAPDAGLRIAAAEDAPRLSGVPSDLRLATSLARLGG